MMTPHTAMVLAAGYGTRMGALTANRPKPLLTVCGQTLLDRTLDLAAAANTQRVVVNLHYLGDQIRAHLEDRALPHITLSEEQPQILDTGGGVAKALPYLGAEPFFVLNSDNVFVGPNPLQAAVQGWNSDRMDVCLLLIPKAHARAYMRPGDFLLDDTGYPVRRGAAAEAAYVYVGVQIMKPDVFKKVPKGPFSMNVIWDHLLEQGRLGVAIYQGTWVDVGTPEGLAAAENALAEHNA